MSLETGTIAVVFVETDSTEVLETSLSQDITPSKYKKWRDIFCHNMDYPDCNSTFRAMSLAVARGEVANTLPARRELATALADVATFHAGQSEKTAKDLNLGQLQRIVGSPMDKLQQALSLWADVGEIRKYRKAIQGERKAFLP